MGHQHSAWFGGEVLNIDIALTAFEHFESISNDEGSWLRLNRAEIVFDDDVVLACITFTRFCKTQHWIRCALNKLILKIPLIPQRKCAAAYDIQFHGM